MDRKRIEAFLAIPKKATHVLQILSFLLVCIVLRLVYLTVYEHETKERQEQARTQKVVVEAPLRGTIQDRFGITLARNQVSYQVSIMWTDIVDRVPRSVMVQDSTGTKRRVLVRKSYVTALSKMLGQALHLPAQRIEDVIYSYAVFSYSVPVPIKRGLSEKEFYTLNAKVRSWPGLVLERTSQRIYPKESTGCHVVGYLSALSREEYDAVISEIHTLRTYLKAKEVEEDVDLPMGISSYFHAKERLEQLERCGYGMLDSVGKAGIEASFDEQLRGIRGYKKYITNARGDIIAPLGASSHALSGKRIKLTISSELQEYCEKLLLMTEKDRQDWWKERHDKKNTHQTAPLFRGGAIVVLDPKTKEVLALASTPRFNPNEMAKKREKTLLVQQHKEKPISWQRSDTLTEAVWDGIVPLAKERATGDLLVHEEEIFLDWDHFVRYLCSSRPCIERALCADRPLSSLLKVQRELFSLAASLNITPKECIEKIVHHEVISERLSRVFDTNNVDEASLLIDLGRLLIRQEKVSPALEEVLGEYSLGTIHQFSRAKSYMLRLLEEKAFLEFQKGPFQIWRSIHEKSFLQEKRKEEEKEKKRGQPYLFYLDRECQRQFQIWWKEVSFLLLKVISGNLSEDVLSRPLKRTLTDALVTFWRESSLNMQRECISFFIALGRCKDRALEDEFLNAIQCYQDLGYELISRYRTGGSTEWITTGKGLVAAIFRLLPPPTFSFAFSQVSPPGSIFKLVTAYAALQQQAMKKDGVVSPSLFTFHDQVFKSNSKVYVGYDSSQKPIPQVYKGGRIPKSLHTNIGPIDIVGALVNSSNPYFALLADEKLHSPQDLVSAARSFGYGEKSGLPLPMEAKGRVPTDLLSDKTSLYTTAIGQHTLLSTPLQSALMLSALTTDGSLYSPKLVQMALGRDVKGSRSTSESARSTQIESLQQLGLRFPLFLEHRLPKSPYRVYIPKAKLRKKLRLDPRVRDILLEGMHQVVQKLQQHKVAMHADFQEMPFVWKAFSDSQGMTGKSSTAESLETIGFSLHEPPYMYSHTAFGAVFFDKEQDIAARKQPSLVVVVFLRYGKFGKHAAPIAAAVRQEWLKIQHAHQGELH